MSAYVIAHLTVIDPDGFEEYRDRVPATIAAHGGEYLVRAGHATDVEGEMPHPRHVVLRFADRAAAERWYNSPEYQEVLKIRLATARSVVTIVDGYQP